MSNLLQKKIYDYSYYIVINIIIVVLLCNLTNVFNSAYASDNHQKNRVDNLIKGFSFDYDQGNNISNKNASTFVKKSFGTVSLDGLVKDKKNNNLYYVGLHLNLKKAWHLYWISAGTAGLPTTIKLNTKDSINIKSAKISYPQPNRMVALGESIAGYENNIYFPLHITLKDINNIENSKLNIKTTVFVCKEQCFRKDVVLSVIFSQLTNTNNSKNLQIAINKLAKPHEISKDILKVSYKNTNIYKGLIYVEVNTTDSKNTDTINDLFLYHKGLNVGKPTVKDLSRGGNSYKLFTFQVNGLDIFQHKNISKNTIDVYMVKNNSFYSIKNTSIHKKSLETADSHSSKNIFLHGKIYYVLLLSVLSGLILNVMPCVLPVLGLKILSITKNTTKPNLLLFFMSLGMISTFTLLGFLLLIFKYMGFAIGWGMQFQSVTFIISMAILMGILAFFMLFEISTLAKMKSFNNLANFLNNKIPLPKGTTSAFLNGFLATVLATPCTAPFMGGVISYSLTLPLGMGLIIYVFMGIGMSSPFLVASIYGDLPKLLSKLTKFNGKIFIIKRLLFIPMIATALWLATIAYDQITHKNNKNSNNNNNIKWHKFEPNKIQELVKSGKIVFVDITADWCLTCKVNEKLVLYSDQGKELVFKRKNVYSMQGDWTNSNDKIASYLAKNNRYSLPFYKVYTPQDTDGKLLPVVLTKAILKSYFPLP